MSGLVVEFFVGFFGQQNFDSKKVLEDREQSECPCDGGKPQIGWFWGDK